MSAIQDKQGQKTTSTISKPAQRAQRLKPASSIATQASVSSQHVVPSKKVARKATVYQDNKRLSPKRTSPKRIIPKVSRDAVVKIESQQFGRQATRPHSKSRSSRPLSGLLRMKQHQAKEGTAAEAEEDQLY
ncbi:hypothetical protein L873DRAFT_1245444 [Choiromyces venosus 120613-1]|uniref:Uncharacterized protein n=1 Tax=Choiromyces venosus 120613-1 TaxID=1336337 RepID=A0A3N4IVW3_9PEZI|nr:hypothetical protein L873DRAFT_1245444 [Choiromyces venosus 120613-1]